MKHGFLALSVAILSVASAFSQCKTSIEHDNIDIKRANECIAIISDEVGRKQYEPFVRSAIQWMLTNAPKWNTKLYVDGATVYDGLATKETDVSKKNVFIDSLMMIFDVRIKNCGDEVNVLNRKATASLKYHINNKEKATELLALFDRVYEISGNNVSDSNLEAYMLVIQFNHQTQKNLSEDQIIRRYDKLSTLIDDRLKRSGSDVEKYKKIQTSVDDRLLTMLEKKVDCSFVKKNIAPKFKKNPKDIPLAKKIFKFMLDGNCAEDPLWLEAAIAIHEVEKDCGLAKNIGKRLIATDVIKAEIFFKEAKTLCKAPNDRADVLILLGLLEAKQGSKTKARDLFHHAAEADPAGKEAFEKIGDLYMNSAEECAKRVSKAEDRLVYLAAYDMYQRSGNQQKMAQARAQFPSGTELFENSWKEGERKKINCWVGETVSLRTRGKE